MAKIIKKIEKKEVKAEKPVAVKKTVIKTVDPKPVEAAAAKKPAVEVEKKTTKKKVVTSEERFRMIKEAAYYIAERNGFGGDDQRYWIEAEAAIDAQFIVK